VLQNLGGIGNLTLVPPAGAAGDAIAFDTGPGVVIIDGVVRTLVPSLLYDTDGALARQGTPITKVVSAMRAHPYFESPPPKTTGREWFSTDYISQFIAACRDAHPEASVADVVATAVSFTAESIADQVARFVPVPFTEFVIAGGGGDNPSLVTAIDAALRARLGSGAPHVRRFADLFFDGGAKESVAFALLGWLHVHGRAGNVPSSTGARAPRVLGSFTPARTLA
jgi:anhydro-N-acetylmuramic acid kinase